MKSILITPKDTEEFKFLTGLLKKLKVAAHPLTEEDMEDIGMAILMKKVNRSKKVSRETIMKKLAS